MLIQGNNLWVPQDGKTLNYDNLARDLGVELGGWSFGAQFGDLNNDGNARSLSGERLHLASKTKSYWYDFSKVAGGNSSIISDAAHWPAFDGRSLSGYQQKKVWINDGAGKFIDVAQAVGVTDRYDGRSVALADLWNTGALDVVVANQGGPLLIYKNERRRGMTGSNSRSKERRAMPAPSARRLRSTGMASNRCSRCPAAAGLLRKMTGACTLDWERIRNCRRP